MVGVPQSGGTLCKLYLLTPPIPGPGHPVFLGSQSCVPAAWLAERLLLAGDIESVCLPREWCPADQVEEMPGRASLEKLGCRTPPQLHAGGVGRQQQVTTTIVKMYTYTGFVVPELLLADYLLLKQSHKVAKN